MILVNKINARVLMQWPGACNSKPQGQTSARSRKSRGPLDAPILYGSKTRVGVGGGIKLFQDNRFENRKKSLDGSVSLPGSYNVVITIPPPPSVL